MPVIYCVSDLHVAALSSRCLFNKSKERMFGLLADLVMAEEATLVLVGDAFDLTGEIGRRRGSTPFSARSTRAVNRPPGPRASCPPKESSR